MVSGLASVSPVHNVVSMDDQTAQSDLGGRTWSGHVLLRSTRGVPPRSGGMMHRPSAVTMSDRLITCRYTLHQFKDWR
jgi:hypothetical protein